MASYLDEKFWIILISVIIVLMILTIIFFIGQQKQPASDSQSPINPTPSPPNCDRPSPMGMITAFIIPNEGTMVQWAAISGAIQYVVYSGDNTLNIDNFNTKIKTTDTFIMYPDMFDINAFFFVCPENDCGIGQCSPITPATLLI